MENSIKNLVEAVLLQALKDYDISIPKIKGEALSKRLRVIRKNYIEAKRWIEEKSRSAFGYYWCLEHSQKNQNKIREYISACDNTNKSKIALIENILGEKL
jgi:hypothetical protein